jgi:hypothetical protein
VTIGFSACSRSGPGFYPVYGKVTFLGKPAAGASVHFHREGETADEAVNFPMGVVDEEGSYTLEVPGVGYGARPGKYKVLVRWSTGKDGISSSSSAAGSKNKKSSPRTETVAELRRDPNAEGDRLKLRYFRLDKPLLFAEVKAETNNIPPFDLEDGPPPAEEKTIRRPPREKERG